MGVRSLQPLQEARGREPGLLQGRTACRRLLLLHLDPEFGPAFIKICTYAPWPAKVWLNGHEWVKRQALRQELGYTELENGFRSCSEPARLQALCDTLSPEHVQTFFDHWISQIPTPLTSEDRAAGYWCELSMRQVEVSRTLVLDDPRRARLFFEALVADNVGIGRPEQISAAFARQLRRPTKHPYRTRIFSQGTEVRIEFRYKSSRVKQYLKGRQEVVPGLVELEVTTVPPARPLRVGAWRAIRQRSKEEPP